MQFECVSSGFCRPSFHCQDFVLDLKKYDSDLGMKTTESVLKQLSLDLSRCNVTMYGTRILSPHTLLRCTSYPRMCTQAVMAPVVEWLTGMGWIAHEVPRSPLKVELSGNKIVIQKTLGIWGSEEDAPEGVHVTITVDTQIASVIVSSSFVFPFMTRSMSVSS
jgi:hypothetical protein